MGQTQTKLSRKINVRPKNAVIPVKYEPAIGFPVQVANDKQRFKKVIIKKMPQNIRNPGKDPRSKKVSSNGTTKVVKLISRSSPTPTQIPSRLPNLSPNVPKTNQRNSKTHPSFPNKYTPKFQKIKSEGDTHPTLFDIYSKRIPEAQCVLLQTFKLISSNQKIITVEDVELFYKKCQDTEIDYQDIREMFHKATNSYEINYEQFLRIMAPEWEGTTLNGELSNLDVPFISNSESMQSLFSDTTTNYSDTYFSDDSSNYNWDVNSEYDLNAMKDNLNEIIFEDFTDSEGLLSDNEKLEDIRHPFYLELPKEIDVSNLDLPLNQFPLDLRSKIDERKKNYGMYNKVHCKSYGGKREEFSIELLSDKNVLPKMLRSYSGLSQLSQLEKKYKVLANVFKLFDQEKTGKISAKDIKEVMEFVGMPCLNNEIKELFKLLGKSTKDTLNVHDFIRMYALCHEFGTNQKQKSPFKKSTNRQSFRIANVTYRSSSKNQGPKPRRL